MISFFKSPLLALTPLVILIAQIYFLLNLDLNSKISPSSPNNQFSQQLAQLFHSAQLEPFNLKFRDFNHEVEFSLQNLSGTTLTVIFSTTKDSLSQVTVLQKLLKQANIEGKDIHYLDLSSPIPYATF